jgi:hypothetical protein
VSPVITVEARVCGGFPVQVEAQIFDPEPDVGEPKEMAEITSIKTLAGKKATFIEKKMTDDDWDACYSAIFNIWNGE